MPSIAATVAVALNVSTMIAPSFVSIAVVSSTPLRPALWQPTSERIAAATRNATCCLSTFMAPPLRFDVAAGESADLPTSMVEATAAAILDLGPIAADRQLAESLQLCDSCPPSPSVYLRAGALHHLGPFRRVLADQLAEVLRRAARG